MRRRPHPAPVRDDTGRTLVTRDVAAYLAHRHPNHIRRAVPAVACDVASRAVLLDLDEVEQLFGGRAHRDRSLLVPLSPA